MVSDLTFSNEVGLKKKKNHFIMLVAFWLFVAFNK